MKSHCIFVCLLYAWKPSHTFVIQIVSSVLLSYILKLILFFFFSSYLSSPFLYSSTHFKMSSFVLLSSSFILQFSLHLLIWKSCDRIDKWVFVCLHLPHHTLCVCGCRYANEKCVQYMCVCVWAGAFLHWQVCVFNCSVFWSQGIHAASAGIHQYNNNNKGSLSFSIIFSRQAAF